MVMMSRTDKTRKWSVIRDDPYNRRFMMVVDDSFSYPFWKKLQSCCRSTCCGGYFKLRSNRRSRKHVNMSMRDARKYAPQHRQDIDIYEKYYW